MNKINLSIPVVIAMVIITLAVLAAAVFLVVLATDVETDRAWRCVSQGMQYVNGACL